MSRYERNEFHERNAQLPIESSIAYEGKVMNDNEFLNWLADRLVNVYGESSNVDFVLKLRALAQPEQRNDSEHLEPVAWYIREKDSATTDGCWAEKNLDICEPVYTTPPQRTWVGLTDEEIESLYEKTESVNWARSFARAIEAKLKEKNT